MWGYIARRVLWAIFVLLAISFLTFVIFSVLPTADPVAMRAGRNASPEVQRAVRHALGLDKAWYEQYWIQLKALVLHFDFGRDYFNDTSVRAELLDRLPATIGLALGAVVLWLAIGIPLGIFAAVRHGRPADRAATGMSMLLMSAPVYWLGLVALFLFSKDIGVVGIFDGSGSYPLSGNLFTRPFAVAPTLFLPWIVLAASFVGIYARFMRASLIEVLGEDYIRTARAKGLSERRVLLRHTLRTSMITFVSLFGLDFGALVAGSTLVTEVVFGIHGVGFLTWQSIGNLDLPTIMVTVIYGAFFIVLANALVDVAYAWLDPRIRPA
jgi:peptide/nickel transport system permease protein